MQKIVLFFFIRFIQAFPHLFWIVLINTNDNGKWIMIVHNKQFIPSKSAFETAHVTGGLIYMYMRDLFNKKRKERENEEKRWFVRLTKLRDDFRCRSMFYDAPWRYIH